MATHLIKLCVGCASVEDLADSVARSAERKRRQGLTPTYVHVTRMVPRRIEALREGGSLYWVIRGSVRARQQLVDIAPFIDPDGIGRCRLVMAPDVVETVWQPRRPFQGWRYLSCADAPPDRIGSEAGDLPAEMTSELAALGVL